MKNRIDVSAQFDFKGETFRPSITLDLDRLMENGEEAPDYYQLLAAENGIGFYSYEYEVLESSELHFSNAAGLAEPFLQEGFFDLSAFRARWQEEKLLSELEAIAREHLDVADLSDQPRLREALLAAFRYGREQQGTGA